METAGHSNMCRCCASEGAFKDIKSTYHWMGEEEIYADMLKDCFDINLNVSEHGEDGGICEVCITQLRNAINFKKQVQHTEEQFKKHLQNKALFRPNIVKVEVGGEEDSDGDNMGSGDDAFSGAEFDVPIKTEEDDPKPKKRSKASATTTRSKKSKSDDGEPSTKRKRRIETKLAIKLLSKTMDQQVTEETIAEQTEPENEAVSEKQKQKTYQIELFKQRYNVHEILLNSNATPIRKYDIGFVCCFCPEQFLAAHELKIHTITNHTDREIMDYTKGFGLKGFLVKLDVTGLQCNLCNTEMDSVEDLMHHLKDDHEKPMFTDIKSYIIPFIFEDSSFKCTFCELQFKKFKVLQEHMHSHYDNFVCNICGSGFVNEKMFISHSDSHKVGIFKCGHCPEEFETPLKKKYHEKTAHLVSMNKCNYCDEKFLWYSQKCLHIRKVHGIKVNEPKECKACDKIFTSDSRLQIHIRRDHLLERTFKCTECNMAFFAKDTLNQHMVRHSGVKRFSCNLCSKTYTLKKGLREHMRIHDNDRRFKCDICDKAFVQKVSWKGHMRSKHGITV
ncbi:PR domain zinc finger protein 5-like isoform X4 [Spodoptera litura]|uniref:PR domain zinc finger protein 5-like isoform X4 n=1 Tax=Spodoptera litura TaxID=69820 RepID=A0A9J7DX50_SPOLT|nr:PR domain zinc finger protein 5-like isoform X4 [Spodoptera litura]